MKRRKSLSKNQTKLRVSAMPGPKELAALVLGVLARYGRLGASTKLIHSETGKPERTLRRILARLLEKRIITSPFRGQWVYDPAGRDITAFPDGTLGFHGLALRCDKWPESTRTVVALASKWKEYILKNGALLRVADHQWEGRWVKFIWHPNRDRMFISVKATGNPVPLDRALEFRGWIQALIEPIQCHSFRIVHIAVNNDHGVARLSPESWEFEDLNGIIWRLYQKNDVLRHEAHLNKPTYAGKPVELDLGMQVLYEGSEVARIERIQVREVERVKAELELEFKRAEVLRLQLQVEEKMARSGPTGKARNPETVLPPDAREEGFG